MRERTGFILLSRSCHDAIAPRAAPHWRGTGWEVIGEDAAAGGAAGTGDWAGCASAAAESASSATTAAEASWLDRIVFIESFLRSDVVRDLEGRCRLHAPAPVGKRLSIRNKRAAAVRSNRPAATRNKPAAAVPRNSPARRSRHRRQGR